MYVNTSLGGGRKAVFCPLILESGRGKEGVLIKGEVGGFLSKSLRIAAEVVKVGQYCVSRTGPAYFFLCANTQKTGFCKKYYMFILGGHAHTNNSRTQAGLFVFVFLNLCQFA